MQKTICTGLVLNYGFGVTASSLVIMLPESDKEPEKVMKCHNSGAPLFEELPTISEI